MFTRILVPLDGSLLAEQAIPHAEQFALIFGATIVLLHILEPISHQKKPEPVDPLSWQIQKAESEMYIQGIAARIRENLKKISNELGIKKKFKVEYAVREGKSAENIVDFAHDENIDLLIICSHGSGGLSRWNISSVIQKVINLIYLPVLIIRAFNQTVIDEIHFNYKGILLPIDSSKRAECSLSAGIELARGELALSQSMKNIDSPTTPLHQAPLPFTPAVERTVHIPPKLILAAVIKPPEIPIPEPYPDEIRRLSDKLMRVSREIVVNYLEEMKERLPVECETCVIENNSVSSAIQDLANREDIDLVVLCAHGYTGEFAWPYGSVARNYIEHGIKPVLIIQDVPRSRVRLSAVEIAAVKTGSR